MKKMVHLLKIEYALGPRTPEGRRDVGARPEEAMEIL